MYNFNNKRDRAHDKNFHRFKFETLKFQLKKKSQHSLLGKVRKVEIKLFCFAAKYIISTLLQ